MQKVNVRPLAVSPLHVVPKANGSPHLFHDLSLLNKFFQRGPKVKHINVLNSAQKLSKKSYFCKLDLSNGHFHLPIREQDREYFGFTFNHTYYISIPYALGFYLLQISFNSFLKKLLEF